MHKAPGRRSRRRGPGRLLLGALVLASLPACQPKAAPLLFHAGAGQRSSLDEIAAVFSARHPGTRIDFGYKGSGYFIADVTASKMGDLYMPGEEDYLLQAVERGFITDYSPSTDIAAHFITVIITPRGNPQGIKTIQDFARPGLRVGLADPEAAAIGHWQEKIFKRAGIWEAVQRNATMSAKCIPELGNAAQHRLIDATIVWSSTAVLYLRDVEILPIEPGLRGVVRLPVGVLRFARQPALARELKALILSEEGRQVFRRHAYAVGAIRTDREGFLAPGETTTDALMEQLRRAAAAVKDPAWTPARLDVGPLREEVLRQRRTTRAGS